LSDFRFKILCEFLKQGACASQAFNPIAKDTCRCSVNSLFKGFNFRVNAILHLGSSFCHVQERQLLGRFQ
jgi:hypothetical protein